MRALCGKGFWSPSKKHSKFSGPPLLGVSGGRELDASELTPNIDAWEGLALASARRG